MKSKRHQQAERHQSKTVCVQVAHILGTNERTWYTRISEPTENYRRILAMLDDDTPETHGFHVKIEVDENSEDELASNA